MDKEGVEDRIVADGDAMMNMPLMPSVHDVED